MRPHDVAPPEPGGDAQPSDPRACGLVGPFELTLAGSRDRSPAASLHVAEDEQEHAALAAQARADGARRRARAARRAADRAATEYARRSHHRVADLHAAMARHFEDLARGLRVRDDDRGPDAA